MPRKWGVSQMKIGLVVVPWLVFGVLTTTSAIAYGQVAPPLQPPTATADTRFPDMKMPDFSEMWKGMSSMSKDVLEAHYTMLARPDMAEKLATFSKNYYEALLKKGFTRDEALKVLLSVQSGVVALGK